MESFGERAFTRLVLQPLTPCSFSMAPPKDPRVARFLRETLAVMNDNGSPLCDLEVAASRVKLAAWYLRLVRQGVFD